MIDFSLDKNKPVQSDDINFVLQQINILFDTNPKEVLGSEEFGSQYDRYLYELNISENNLKQKIISDLNSLYLCGYKYNVNVYMCRGTERDIALIEIDLFKEHSHYKQTYKIS